MGSGSGLNLADGAVACRVKFLSLNGGFFTNHCRHYLRRSSRPASCKARDLPQKKRHCTARKSGISPSELLQPVLYFVCRALWFLKSKCERQLWTMRGWKYTRLVGKDTIFLFFQAGYVHLPRFQTEVLAQYARKCTFLMSSRNERSPPAAFALAACTISVKDGHAIDARQVFAINKRNEKTQTIREQSHSLDPKRLHHLYRCISLRGKRFSVGSSVQCVSRSTATMHLHLLLPP